MEFGPTLLGRNRSNICAFQIPASSRHLEWAGRFQTPAFEQDIDKRQRILNTRLQIEHFGVCVRFRTRVSEDRTKLYDDLEDTLRTEYLGNATNF